MPYTADPFDPTKPGGGLAAGYGDEELKAIKQVLVDWRTFIETTAPAALTAFDAAITDIETTLVAAGVNIAQAATLATPAPDTGAVDVYKRTMDPVLVAHPQGLIAFTPANTNTSTAPTFTFDSLPAKTIKLMTGEAIWVGAILQNRVTLLLRDVVNDCYLLVNPAKQSSESALYTAASGNFTVPAGVYFLGADIQAGGGRGGNRAATSASIGGQVGGGAGAYITAEFPVVPGDVIAYVAGAAQADSSITYGTMVLLAEKGENGDSSLRAATADAPGASGGAVVITNASGPVYREQGEDSGNMEVGGVATYVGTPGANSRFGEGGAAGSSGNGSAGTGYGAGGGGAFGADGGSHPTRNGGQGAPGFVRFRYSRQG